MPRQSTSKKPKKPVAKWHGDGSVFQRKDGRWVASVPYKDALNVPRRIEKYFKTPEEAWVGWQELLDRRARGLLQSRDIKTVEQLANAWLDNIVRPHLKPLSILNYSQAVKNHITPDLGPLDLSEVKTRQVQALVNKLLAEKVGAVTIRYTHRVLKQIFKQGIEWDLIEKNPADGVRLPIEEKTETTVFTLEQAQTFLNAIKGHKYEVLYTVALSLGLRRGEMLGLRWQDIDLDAKRLSVTRNLQYVYKELIMGTPKTRSSRADLPLPMVLVTRLRAHRVKQKEERLAGGAAWQDWRNEGLVFTGRRGEPLNAATVLRQLHLVLKQAKLPDLTLHELRKSCATLLHAQGVPDKEIQMVMRHSSVEITRNLYIQGDKQIQSSAIDDYGESLYGK